LDDVDNGNDKAIKFMTTGTAIQYYVFIYIFISHVKIDKLKARLSSVQRIPVINHYP